MMEGKKMKDKEKMVAERFNILEIVQKLESELLKIDGITEVEFDLSGFFDNLNEVILLTKYDIPNDTKEYFEKKKELRDQVVGVAEGNFLTRTGDRIEDYGEHFYFVFHCLKEWNKSK